jgi:hypothetical protein
MNSLLYLLIVYNSKALTNPRRIAMPSSGKFKHAYRPPPHIVLRLRDQLYVPRGDGTHYSATIYSTLSFPAPKQKFRKKMAKTKRPKKYGKR